MPSTVIDPRKVVFLDRDGVINRLMVERGPKETPRTADDVVLLPRVKEALQLLKQNGYTLIVITNQPNVAKGKSTWEDMEAIIARMAGLLGSDAAVDAIYACHHHPDAAQVVVPELLQDCDCRKPKPGLILQAVQEYAITVTTTWFVGDSDTDMEAAKAAGIPEERCILIGTHADDLWAATQTILANESTH